MQGDRCFHSARPQTPVLLLQSRRYQSHGTHGDSQVGNGESISIPKSVMEQPDACKRHHHTVFVAAVDDSIIADGSAGLCHILHT